MDTDRDFSNEFVREILALLDSIDVQEDADLAGQRFAIARKHGFTVVFEEPISSSVN